METIKQNPARKRRSRLAISHRGEKRQGTPVQQWLELGERVADALIGSVYTDFRPEAFDDFDTLNWPTVML